MTTRRSYSASFKLSVVHELAGGTSAGTVAQRNGVTSSMVRKWSANRSELEAAVAQEGSKGQQLKLGTGRKPCHAAVDRALLQWVMKQKGIGERVKDTDMQEQARVLALEQGITDFRASKGYVSNFKRRNKLSVSAKRSRGRPNSTIVTEGRQIAGAEASTVSQEREAPGAQAADVTQEVITGARTTAMTQGQEKVVQGADGDSRECMFGMDLGLKNVKCAVVCATTGSILATSSSPIQTDDSLQEDERSVANVLLAVRQTIEKIPTHLRLRIRSIGICGVMHGIMWWRCNSVRKAMSDLLSAEGGKSTISDYAIRPWSPYVTFLDQRCTSPLLDKWRDKIKHANFTPTASLSANDNCSASSPIASGYGLAIFAYMVEKHPQDLVGFDACGTIHDFVGFALCGHSVPAQNCMDTTDAYSWGGFDINTKTWNLRTVKALGLPAHMLPAVKAPGAVIGQTSGISAMLGLPSGKPVYLPMGDHPCAVMTAIAQTQGPADVNISRTSVLSIGSASQLAMVLTEEDAEQLKTSRGSCSLSFEVRPFLSENWFLGVAPSLSGGNMFAWFMKQCQEWSQQLVLDPAANHLSEEAMYARVIALGGAKLDTDLKFTPTLHGEWAAPEVKGSIEQLQTSNWSLGDISAAICRGLIDNIFSMVPDDLRADLLRHPMIGTGGALVRNNLLRHFLAHKLAHASQLSIQNTADAAVGVAFIPSFLQK